MKGIYIVGGYPDLKRYIEVLKIIKDTNIDFVEIGLPFNDPVADGPVISGAINEVVKKNYSVEDILEPAKEILRKKKLYIMTYANLVYNLSYKKFYDFNGLIIADCPNRFHKFFYKRGLKTPIIPFSTLETRESDLKYIKSSKADFVYFISIRGTTGGKVNLNSKDIFKKLKAIKRSTIKKVIFGFGIKAKSDIKKILKVADGFVIGTQTVKRQNNILNLKKFFKSLEFLW